MSHYFWLIFLIIKSFLQTEVEEGKRNDVLIELDDVYSFDDFGPELADAIQKNTSRYIEIFASILEKRISLFSLEVLVDYKCLIFL